MTAAAVGRATGRALSIGAVIRRSPLALAMMTVTTISAVATGALNGGTPGSTVDRLGYSLDSVTAGHLWVLVTGDWIVYNARHWASMLLLFALFCVPLEALAGPKLLAAAFWIGSWGGTAATSLLVWFWGAPLDWHPRPDLIHQADVGGSVGAWSAAGVLAVLLWRQPGWLLWPAGAAMAAYLLRQLVVVHGGADVAHLLGFLIGAGLGLRQVRRHGFVRPIGRADLARAWRGRGRRVGRRQATRLARGGRDA